MKTFLVLVLTLVISPQAFACRGPSLETRSFFNELPPALLSKQAVAKVRVLSSQVNKVYERITTAKVISAIRGLKQGAVIKISSDTSSCNHDPEIHIEQNYYVAGAIGSDVFFRGTWKQPDLIGVK